MKIVICPTACVPIHATSLDERPLGGTETGIIRVSEVLAERGHEVTVLTRMENSVSGKARYVSFKHANEVGAVDAIIAVREWIPLVSPLRCKKFFWTGDSYDQPHNLGMGDRRVAAMMHGFFAVSEWHRKSLCLASGFPEQKAFVVGNGVHLPYFSGSEERKRKRLIYSSTPYRGLALIPALFSELKKRHPDIELHIFSGYGVYAGPQGYEARAQAQYEELAERLKQQGCVVHGNVTQGQLAREFMKSSLLFYPNTFEETSCISAMEAQAAGCAIVTSARGALPETVGESGILIEGKPGTEEYMRAFLDAADKILSDDQTFERLSRTGQERARQMFSWERVAERMLRVL